MKQKTRLMRGRPWQWLQVAALMIVMLAGGASPAWAVKWSDPETKTDEGGGNYKFYMGGDTGVPLGSSGSAAYFKTLNGFDVDKNQFYWAFDARVFSGVNSGTVQDESDECAIYVVTSDGVSQKIATFKKDYNTSKVTFNTVTDKWGNVSVSTIHDTNRLTFYYVPNGQAVKDGVKGISIQNRYTYGNWGGGIWYRYDKDITLSSITADKPMPKPTVDWGTDGKLAFKVTGVPDKRGNKKVGSQGYVVDMYYYENGQQSSKDNGFTTGVNNLTYSNETNGKMDVAFNYWPLTQQTQYAKAAYTVPVYVDYYAYMRLNQDGNIVPDRHVLAQPKVEGVLVKPFTRPTKVTVEFDKWSKKNTVKWTRQTSAKGFNGQKVVDVECRYDGKWHVLRYEKSKGAGTYKELGTVDGTQTKLELTDTDFDYDREYVYRVVFLPTILETAYGTKMHQLPGYQNSTHTSYDLWEEQTVSTALGVKISLSQDMSYTSKVRLKWQYSLPKSGLTWYIEYKPTGGTTWQERTETIPVDQNQTEATADFNGSVCDAVTYRIKTKISGQDVYSDTLVTRLSSGSYIRKVTATTGTEQTVVKVEWEVENADPTNEIKYLVRRRPVGTEEWTTVSDSIPGTQERYSWTDERPQTGTYYEYTVEAYGTKCPEQVVKMDGIVVPGFSQARGTITGHIAYGSGTAVQDARVNLVKASADQENDQVQFLSRYIEGAGKGLVWQADAEKYGKVLNGSQPATLQLWAKPASDGSSQMALATLNGALQVGVKRVGGNYCLYAIDLSSGNASTYKEKEFPKLTFSEIDFTHVAATYDAGKWKFYVGTDSLLVDSMTVANRNWQAAAEAGRNTLAIGGSEQAVHAGYKGYVDDIRLWTRALGEDELTSSYTRILGGTEEGLALYWPLDEGENVQQYAFDIACQGGLYTLNHPQVGPNATPRREVPSLLKLYGVTDAKGNYIIKGIPFQQGGTNYEITPRLGVHNFSPATRTMYVSPTSLTANNIDFEDVSSFPMEGYVYYAGTNIPAEGIMLYVDGQLQSYEGKFIQTDDKGYYRMSVPIGEHYVEAKLQDHTMVDGGRYPLKGKATFTEGVRYDFYDATTVNFVGRVGGGERNDTLAVGFGRSVNNIGVATVTLKVNNEKLSFNRVEGQPEVSATAIRPWESDTVSIRSHTFTGTDSPNSTYKDNYIYIQTDSTTGEFSAKLPPLKYTVKSIAIGSNQSIEFTELPEIDLTVAGSTRTDSLKVPKNENSADSVWVKYKYHTKMVRTYFAPPQMDVVEKGLDAGFFGLEQITYAPQVEGQQPVTISGLRKAGADGKAEYLLGYPIYQQGSTQNYVLKAYELYENRDSAATNNVKQYPIPLNGQEVIIGNEMSAIQNVVCRVDDPNLGYKAGDVYDMVNERLTLDENGEGELKWTAGPPNIVSPYTRHFGVSLTRKKRVYNVASLDAVVLGQLTTGSNFVTQGPDEVLFTLRDPYGAHSKTTLKKGEVTTRTKSSVSRAYGDHSAVTNLIIGSDFETAEGVPGMMLMSGMKSHADVQIGAHATWEKTWSNDSTWVTTTIDEISTSDKSPYVGASGDVFVGNSKNLVVGTCRYLHIVKNAETQKYELVLEDALSLGDRIKTTFYYTDYELRTVMIPKWKDMRKQFMDTGVRVESQAAAESYENTGKHATYVTWKKPTDADYGLEDTYIFKEPKVRPETTEVDSVLWCNQQIKSWEQVLYNNEKEKVEAIKKGGATNISIDGGSSYSYTYRYDKIGERDTVSTWKLGLVTGFDLGLKVEAVSAVGCILNVKSEQGGGKTTSDGQKKDDYSEWEYTFSDGNRDVDISINQYETKDLKKGRIFSLFGGQTYNPYEAADSTHYYNPGTPLGNGTVQMEQPYMTIGLPGENSAKSVTVTDIPAGGEANVTLYCTNMANTHQGIDFTYDILVLDETNKNGLQILMDGVPINGRGVYLGHGEATTKVLTIRQTDQSVMDFEGIKFWLASQYQAAKIHDEVTLNAHFAPSSSPVTLAIAEPVVNSNTVGGKLDMKLSGFNRQFTNLRNVGVQYRFQGSTQWTNLYTWWKEEKDTIGVDTLSNTLLPKTGDLYHSLNMTSDLSYPEGQYEFRAFTTTPYGTEQVQVYSDVITVTKDRTRPTNLYTPAPANGILGYGDQLAIEFNEDIVPGYVGADNVIVTARLNQDKVAHEVALGLRPYDATPRTANPVFLNGDFSLEFWMKWEVAGTILHHGASTDHFALAIDDAGYVTATIAGTKFVSKQAVPKGEWTFVAISYKSSERTFNGMAVYGTSEALLFNNEQVPTEALQAVTAAVDNYLYLGNVLADMHSLALYNINRDVNLAIAEKDVAKDNYVYGLTNYWPMDEGHGSVASDLRHTHDFTGVEEWSISNVNYALRIDDVNGVAADISQVTTSRGDSYAVELWYLRSGETGETVIETATPDATGDRQQKYNKLKLYYNADKDLVLDYGEKSQTVASHDDFDLMIGWHHYALNVVRGQAASFYVDGQRTAVIAEADVPPLEGSRLLLGQKVKLAMMDELRIWHASLSEKRIQQNIYNALDTADIYTRGLVAYYPMEKQGTENGVDTKVVTLENMTPNLPKSGAKELLYDNFTEGYMTTFTPPLKNAPDERKLVATPVASERKVVINLTGATVTPRQLEGCTLNITVDKVRDLHGNTSLPIRWTAYVQQNTLKWTRDSVNVFKQYGDDYTFDVDIENQSGNTELYTLYNMPQWLSIVDSERTDELDPLSTKVLRFRVDPLVAVGNYDVTIGLQGNNQILEPLRIVMKVSGEAPDWTVDPTEYQHQMTIIGQVYLNGILMENEESMVAAFIGGECRGVAQPKQVRGAAYVTMNVYGTDDERYDRDKPVSFRIWDASRGVAYTNANISAGNVKVYDNPKVEFKWTSNGEVDNTVQRYFALRILDHDGNVAKNWFVAENVNTVTYPYGYSLEVLTVEDDSTHTFTLDKNMTIVCNVKQRSQWDDPECTVKIESSSDVEWHYGASVVFQQDAMIGNYNTPTIWTKSDDVEQQVSVHQNWNWIAFGVEPESQYLDHVFSDLADWQLLLKNREAMNDWNGAEWGYGKLRTPTVNEMYKLRITRLPSTPKDATVPSVMTVSGRQPVAAANAEDAAKLAVTLAQGWNWIAYTPLTTMTIGEALAAASPQPGDIVKSQTGVAIYDQNGWEGTLTALEGGHGYMYYSVDGETKSFVYPAAASTSAAARRAVANSSFVTLHSSFFSPIDPTLYPNNMTMVIQLKDGETVVDTCEVAAFVDGECRGAARASQNGLYYLVIAGDGAGQAMTLRTSLDGQITDLDKTLQFVSDDNIGTTWDPYVIDLSNLVNGIHNITADDTDDGDWWTLQGFKIGRKPTVPGVYIHHGQKVTIRRNK